MPVNVHLIENIIRQLNFFISLVHLKFALISSGNGEFKHWKCFGGLTIKLFVGFGHTGRIYVHNYGCLEENTYTDKEVYQYFIW